MIEQRDDLGVEPAVRVEPARLRPAPDRVDAAANKFAPVAAQPIDRALQPVRLEPSVVVGCRNHPALRRLDARVERRVFPGFALEEVADRERVILRRVFDDLTGVVVGPVVDDQQFDATGAVDQRQARERVAQGVCPIGCADDDRNVDVGQRSLGRRS